MKAVCLILLIAVLPIVGSAQTKFEMDFEKLKNAFGPIPESMSSEEIESFKKQKDQALDRDLLYVIGIESPDPDAYYLPLGTFSKGKQHTFLWFEVNIESHSTTPLFAIVNATTVHSKKGTAEYSTRYVLEHGDTFTQTNIKKRDGFERDGDILIIHHKTLEDGEEPKEYIKKYEMHKYLDFIME